MLQYHKFFKIKITEILEDKMANTVALNPYAALIMAQL